MTTLIPKYYQGGTSAVNRPFNEKLQEIVSVKDFGATGDGSTNDATAIIAALDSLTNGGILYFPKGTYIVGQAIPIKQGIHYLGESPLSSILKASATSFDNILGYGYPTTDQQTAQNNFIVENLTFDGNKAARTENQLALFGTVTGTFVDGEVITSSSGGSAKVAAHDVGGTFVTLNPVGITGTFTVGNTVTGAGGATMVIASKAADDAYQINVRCQSATNFRITNCKIINSFFTALSLYSNCQIGTVDNCSLINNNKSGTVLSSPYNIYIESYANTLTVYNNYITGGLGSGIVVRGGIVQDVKIINNTISFTPNYGVELTASGFAFTDVTVQGNRFYQAPNASPDAVTVISTGSGSVMVGININNNIFDTGQIGVGLRPASSGTISNVVISDNIFKDYTTYTAGIFSSGTSNVSVFGNQSNTSAFFIDATASTNSFQNLQVKWFTGTGSPQSVVTAPVGSLFSRVDGGASTTLYVKESGTGNTGWVAK